MRLAFLAVSCVTFSSGWVHAARAAEPLAELDSEIQRELMLASEQVSGMERSAQTEKLSADLGSLAPLLKRDGESILRQMVLFYPQASQKQRFALMFIRNILILPSSAELSAIAPFVDADDEKLRTVALDMLAATARRGSALVPNLEPFLLYLSGPGRKNPSERLIRFIFHLDPCQALDGMERFGFVRVRGGDADVALRGQVIANGIWLDRADVFFRDKAIRAKLHEAMPEVEQALFDLAGNDTWWVRLCAAEVVRKYERFRTEKVMERLRGDKHPAILDVLEQIRAGG